MWYSFDVRCLHEKYLRTRQKTADRELCPTCLPCRFYLYSHLRKDFSMRSHGWLGTSFMPEHASMFLDPIATGALRAGRTLGDLELQVSAGVVAFSDDVASLIAPRKPGLAFTLGAMGSRQHNFYNEVYQRAGYADVAH